MIQQQNPAIPFVPADPKAELLAQLHDVIEPETLSWWPPAPGWWLLAAVVIATMAMLILYLIQRHRQQRYRREALATLKNLAQQRDQSKAELARQLVELSKRTFFSAHPGSRAQVAGLAGGQWLKVLTSTCRRLQQHHLPDNVDTLLYSADCKNAEQSLKCLFDCIEIWIKRHKTQPWDKIKLRFPASNATQQEAVHAGV